MMRLTLSHHPSIVMLWLPLLVGLQGVPHTGGLRTLFLLVGIGHLAWLKRSTSEPLPPLQCKFDCLAFWLLSAWLILHASLLAVDSHTAFRELADNWAKLILMTFIGIWLGKLIMDEAWISIALFSGAFLHVLSVLGAQIISLSNGNGFAFQESLLSEYPLAATFTTIAIAWLLADGVACIKGTRRIFPWPPAVSIVLILLALTAEALLKAKSGEIMFVVLAIIVAAILFGRSGLRRKTKILLAVVCASVFGLITISSLDRWTKMNESIQAALQGPLPIRALVTDNIDIPAGTDHSFYMRALRAKVGLEGIASHPWGIGFSTDVYRRYVNDRYGITDGILSSNSGLLDFTLAAGLPGLLLLLLLAGALIGRGWSAYRNGRAEGLALMLLVVNQLGVYALDGTLAGSRFSGFALIAGALWRLSAMKDGEYHRR